MEEINSIDVKQISDYLSKIGPLDVRVDLTGAILLGFSTPVGTELKMAIVAPERTPRVLDEPVIALAATFIAFTISNNSHCMVDISQVWITAVASMISNNTLTVAL